MCAGEKVVKQWLEDGWNRGLLCSVEGNGGERSQGSVCKATLLRWAAALVDIMGADDGLCGTQEKTSFS